MELHGEQPCTGVNSRERIGMILARAVLGRAKVKAMHGQASGEIRVTQEFIQNFPENKTHDFMCLPIRAETG